MIQPIQIRSVEIGSGVPKIIVPIVGKTQEAILAKAAEIAGMPIHMVEWRADFYEPRADEALARVGHRSLHHDRLSH